LQHIASLLDEHGNFPDSIDRTSASVHPSLHLYI
jgi:hypothetical protein